jgi:drug/metabolite transporter (DMT)-like permease
MPASLLVVTRMALAGVVLAVVFFLTGGAQEIRRSGHARRLWILGFVVGLEMITLFTAIRLTDVTVAVALEYLSPVWLAVAAPWFLRTRRHGVDMLAVGIALAGMAVIVIPSVGFAATAGSVPGIVLGILNGMCFAAAVMIIKSIGGGVRGTTYALFYCVGSVILLAPLAVWQTAHSHYRLTGTDLWIVVVSGLVYTALCFSLYSDGVRFVRAEHAGILGYLEPVTAPLWALLLIGEVPAWTAVAGGALIVAAGVLAVVKGGADAEAAAGPVA